VFESRIKYEAGAWCWRDP